MVNLLHKLERFVSNHPLITAVVIDIVMLFPFFDIVITLPLQYYLWKSLKSQKLMILNIGYDIIGDFFAGMGDMFPLNTVSVLFIYSRKWLKELFHI